MVESGLGHVSCFIFGPEIDRRIRGGVIGDGKIAGVYPFLRISGPCKAGKEKIAYEDPALYSIG